MGKKSWEEGFFFFKSILIGAEWYFLHNVVFSGTLAVSWKPATQLEEGRCVGEQAADQIVLCQISHESGHSINI